MELVNVLKDHPWMKIPVRPEVLRQGGYVWRLELAYLLSVHSVKNAFSCTSTREESNTVSQQQQQQQHKELHKVRVDVVVEIERVFEGEKKREWIIFSFSFFFFST